MTFQDHRKNATDFALAQISPRATGQSEYQRKTPLRDKVFSVLALLLTSPILVIMTLCIVIAGQNPLFVQERIGQYCRTFRIFKFRTIPQEGWAAAEAAAQTPVMRTQLFLFHKVSRILRKTGLDELPQFVNILRGDMQIIGPRPLVAKDFDALPEGREVRCMVLPGITGLAQINGGQDLDPHSKLALDLYVIDHLSVRVTAKIVMRTMLRILGVTSATASISSVDVNRARDHMRRASIAMPAVAKRAQAVRHPQHDLLIAPAADDPVRSARNALARSAALRLGDTSDELEDIAHM